MRHKTVIVVVALIAVCVVIQVSRRPLEFPRLAPRTVAADQQDSNQTPPSRFAPSSSDLNAKHSDVLDREKDSWSPTEAGTGLDKQNSADLRANGSDQESSVDRTSEFPPHGSELTLTQAQDLLTGTVDFKPASIPSSDVPVDAGTPLAIGQGLQVKWGDAWWAGSVVRFEPDGKIRVHYFGWDDTWDEPKPRTELQLDGLAALRAIDSVYVRQGR